LTILYSSKVADTKPLSAIIIGLPDTGKTEILMQASDMKGVSIQNYLTSYGLSTMLGKIQNKEIMTIIIPDFSRIIKGGSSPSENLMAALNSLIEEGVANITTYRTQFAMDKKKPVRCNMLTALTIDSYTKNKKSWIELGALTRMVPFFLGYTTDDIEKALNTIATNTLAFHNYPEPILEEQCEVEINAGQVSVLKQISGYIGKVNSDATSFRSFKNLKTLTKAHALAKGRTKVNQQDIDFVRSLLPFWFSQPGNDCEYYILQVFFDNPAKTVTISMIKRELENMYCEETLDECLHQLVMKRILILSDNGGIVLCV
jgi:hypothetical protein